MPAQQVLRIFFKLFPPLAFAARSDSVRRPIGFRTLSDDLTTAPTQQIDRHNTTNRPPQHNKPTAATLLFHNI